MGQALLEGAAHECAGLRFLARAIADGELQGGRVVLGTERPVQQEDRLNCTVCGHEHLRHPVRERRPLVLGGNAQPQARPAQRQHDA
jgi:hypothetical protein